MTKHKTTQIVNKFKNSKCDITQQLKMWQDSKTQNVTKLTKSKCEKINKSKCDKTQKLKIWQNLKLKKTKQKTKYVTNL